MVTPVGSAPVQQFSTPAETAPRIDASATGRLPGIDTAADQPVSPRVPDSPSQSMRSPLKQAMRMLAIGVGGLAGLAGGAIIGGPLGGAIGLVACASLAKSLFDCVDESMTGGQESGSGTASHQPIAEDGPRRRDGAAQGPQASGGASASHNGISASTVMSTMAVTSLMTAVL